MPNSKGMGEAGLVRIIRRPFTDHYILVKRKPLPCYDPEFWDRWMRGPREQRLVAFDKFIDLTIVETYFVGCDVAPQTSERPLVFQTVVLGGRMNGTVENYPTWGTAEDGHLLYCWHVKESLQIGLLFAVLVRFSWDAPPSATKFRLCLGIHPGECQESVVVEFANSVIVDLDMADDWFATVQTVGKAGESEPSRQVLLDCPDAVTALEAEIIRLRKASGGRSAGRSEPRPACLR